MGISDQPASVVAAADALNAAMTSASITDPEILEVLQQDGQVILHLRVQPELSWFQGHFPEVALLPGVVQTTWAVQFGRRYFDLPPQFQSMSNMKFMRFIMPGAHIELHLKYLAAKCELVFEYREGNAEGNAVCASGRMGFGVATQQPGQQR